MPSQDMTYCASPNCWGKCGRALMQAESDVDMYRISWAYFCDENGEPIKEEKPDA